MQWKERDCSKLNAYIPHFNLYVETLIPKDDGISRGDLWEMIRSWGETLRMQLVPFKKRGQRDPLQILRTDAARTRQLWTREWPSTESYHAGALISAL